MIVKSIQAEQTLPIRHQVLWPDKPLSFCQVEGDDRAWHLGGFVDDQLVAVASIYCLGNEARLRKFATLPDYQGQGIGTAILTEVLAQLHTQAVAYFWCDARESAMDFYRRFGMAPEGERFFKGVIPYVRMSRSVADA